MLRRYIVIRDLMWIIPLLLELKMFTLATKHEMTPQLFESVICLVLMPLESVALWAAQKTNSQHSSNFASF